MNLMHSSLIVIAICLTIIAGTVYSRQRSKHTTYVTLLDVKAALEKALDTMDDQKIKQLEAEVHKEISDKEILAIVQMRIQKKLDNDVEALRPKYEPAESITTDSPQNINNGIDVEKMIASGTNLDTIVTALIKQQIRKALLESLANSLYEQLNVDEIFYK